MASAPVDLDADLEEFLVGNRRGVAVPGGPNRARVCVLNAMRTISPSVVRLELAGAEPLSFVLYDWFYHNLKLHMLVIDLVTYRLHDAQVLCKDLLHLAVGCGLLAPTRVPPQPFSSWHIQCSENEWRCLDSELPRSVQTCRFCDGLRRWLGEQGQPGSLLQAASRRPPTSWIPLAEQHQAYLRDTPELASPCVNCPCHACHALHEHLHAQPRLLQLAELLMWVPSGLKAPQLRGLVEDTCEALRLVGSVRLLSAASPSFTDEGARRRCELCKQDARCYWTDCCNPKEPVACEIHGRLLALQAFSPCPKHGITGRVAILL
jgi:hypothetical protein